MKVGDKIELCCLSPINGFSVGRYYDAEIVGYQDSGFFAKYDGTEIVVWVWRHWFKMGDTWRKKETK